MPVIFSTSGMAIFVFILLLLYILFLSGYIPVCTTTGVYHLRSYVSDTDAPDAPMQKHKHNRSARHSHRTAIAFELKQNGWEGPLYKCQYIRHIYWITHHPDTSIVMGFKWWFIVAFIGAIATATATATTIAPYPVLLVCALLVLFVLGDRVSRWVKWWWWSGGRVSAITAVAITPKVLTCYCNIT